MPASRARERARIETITMPNCHIRRCRALASARGLKQGQTLRADNGTCSLSRARERARIETIRDRGVDLARGSRARERARIETIDSGLIRRWSQVARSRARAD